MSFFFFFFFFCIHSRYINRYLTLSAWERVHSRALAQESILNDFEKEPAGVYVKASTLGSLEALLSFLQEGAGCAPGGAALVCGSPIFVVI